MGAMGGDHARAQELAAFRTDAPYDYRRMHSGAPRTGLRVRNTSRIAPACLGEWRITIGRHPAPARPQSPDADWVRSKLGRKVAVDLEANTDLDESRESSTPLSSLLHFYRNYTTHFGVQCKPGCAVVQSQKA